MKRKLFVSLMICMLMFTLAGCADSGADVNQQPPSNSAESPADESGEGTSEFVYNPKEVKKLNLDIELKSGEEWEYDFDRDEQEAEIEYENGSDNDREGQGAFQEIEGLLAALNIDLDRPVDEMIGEILSHVEIQRENLEEIDFEIEMYSGEKVGFKYHIGSANKNDTIDEFDMDIKFTSGAEWDYEYDLDDPEFEVEYSDGNDLDGQDAKNEMERILSEVEIGLDKSIAQMKKDFLAAIDVNEDEIKEWDFEVEFQNGETIKAKHDIKT